MQENLHTPQTLPDEAVLNKTRHSNEKYTAEKIIEALKTSRGMIAVAARVLGCDRKTIYNAIQRHPAINEVVAGERELMVDSAELKLIEAIHKGQSWAIAFCLKTQGRSRGYVERQETVNTVVSMADLVLMSHIPADSTSSGNDTA